MTRYGYWILVYSLPSILSLTNIGIGTFTSNQIAIYSAKGEWSLAKKAYSTAIITLSLFLLIVILSFYLAFAFFDFNSIFGLGDSFGQEFKTALIFLIITVLLSFFYEIYNGVLRSCYKAHVYNFLKGIQPLLNLLAMFIVFQVTSSFKVLAFGILVSNIFFFVILIAVSRIYNKKLTLSVSDFSNNELKYLFKNGFSWQLFSLSNTILIQGNLFVVQYLLGPKYVALYNTVRTIINSTKQIQEVFTSSIWPELTSSMAVGNFIVAKKLHRYAVLVSVLISFFTIIVLFFSRALITDLWLHNSLYIPKLFYTISLIGVVFYAFWYPSSTVHFALNQHSSLSYSYFLFSLMQLVFCYVLTKVFNLNGATFALLIFDIFMIPVVFSRSLILTHDTRSEFFIGVGEIIKNKVLIKLKKY